MITDRHVFDPELDRNWISLEENTLDSILRVGVWEIESVLECNFGWIGYTLDTFKDRVRCNFDLDSIQAFDLKFNTFDGTTIVQSLSDRAESSFYDPIWFGSIPNARIVPPYQLEPLIFWIDVNYDYRPDLELRWKSDHRHWTLFRKYACYTIKYAFGGNWDYGWWTPLEHKWDTYPLGVTRFDANHDLGVEFVFDGPPYVQRTEFSTEWFKYKFTFDWPTNFDLGCKLDDWYYKWYLFYQVTTGYDKFATVANLTKYDPFIGEVLYRNTNEWCFRYNYQDNVNFGYKGSVVKIFSNPFNPVVPAGTSIQLWATIQWAGVTKNGTNLVTWRTLYGTGTFTTHNKTITPEVDNDGDDDIANGDMTVDGDYTVFTPTSEGEIIIQAVYEGVSATISIRVGEALQYTLSSNKIVVGSGQPFQLILTGGAPIPLPLPLSVDEIPAEVVVLTGRLDYRGNFRPPEFDMVMTSIPEFNITFGPRLGTWNIQTIEDLSGWGTSMWSLDNFGD